MNDNPHVVVIELGEELSQLTAISNLIRLTHMDVVESCMIEMRNNPINDINKQGAQLTLDICQAAREYKSACDAYARFIIELDDKQKHQPR